jgi:hypothetical protein
MLQGHRAERESLGYRSTAQAKDPTAPQIAAQSPSDKSNTTTRGGTLTSRGTGARNHGRSSAEYAPSNRTPLSSMSTVLEWAPIPDAIAMVNAELAGVKKASLAGAGMAGTTRLPFVQRS